MKKLSEHGRDFLTPEGVPLPLRVAYTPERLVAIVIDVAIILIAMQALSRVCSVFIASQDNPTIASVASILGLFFLRNFYFFFFEMRPAASSPGKRVMRLRVISRDGGRLTSDAIFTRGLSREIEIWMPYYLLMSADIPRMLNLADLLWMATFLCIPLCTPDRTRVGDLIAGTCVVAVPRIHLTALSDLSSDPYPDLPIMVFSPAQLRYYGLDDFSKLESLASDKPSRDRTRAIQAIRRNIGWAGPEDDDAFIQGYCAAVRQNLENEMQAAQGTMTPLNTPGAQPLKNRG